MELGIHVLAEITDDPGEAGLLARHAALEQRIAETPLVAGNRTRILEDGPETWRVRVTKTATSMVP